ncbi:MAG: CHAP domain-containing protein [Clostridia bacterium]|nr:CHAP domain-containing protein [Clostridia bacterium]
MEKATREKLAKAAREKALIPFHGYIQGQASNLAPIIRFFPKWTLEEADGLWCAAFVYFCCVEAGFEIPYRPKECIACHLAGCLGWEEFAISDPQITYRKRTEAYVPQAGDIVLYDRVFNSQEHDHMGIVLQKRKDTILAAEGNVRNVSGLIERPLDEHIRAYIRIPDGYQYHGGNHENW